MIKKTILLVLMGISLNLHAQSSVEQVLEAIRTNNPDLKIHRQYIEAQKTRLKTGLNPENPEVEYEKSFVSEEGKPVEILVSQSFDFPTVYVYRNQLAKDRVQNLENRFARSRQEILLKAKLTCLQLIYRQKMQTELEKRYQNAQKLFSHFEKKMQEGDATILDVNKVKMEALNSQNRMRLNQSEIAVLKEELNRLNGGIPVAFTPADYTPAAIKESYEELVQKFMPHDPVRNSLLQKEKIAAKEVSLARAQSLPKWSVGYRYLNAGIYQKASGFQVGLSIPLWENKNRVKQAQLMQKFRGEAVNVHDLAFESEIKQLYQRYHDLKKNLDEYQKVLTEINSTALLEKALNFGEISSIAYFLELSYYYNSYDTFLEVEHEYYKTIARIFRSEL